MPLRTHTDRGAVFVTGGTGLLGKRIVLRLTQSGYNVRVLSRKQDHDENTKGIHFVCGDIRDTKLVKETVSGCDAVFHCAAEIQNVNKMYEVNVIGTRNVYEAALRNGVRFFCHLSSVGVIGRTNQRVVDEDTPCNPMSSYERTKLEAEQIVMEHRETCRSVILRPTNVFSEETIDLDSYRGLRSAIKIRLNGNERSHLVYVSDVVEAGIYFLQNSTPQGYQIFIVSSDEEPGGTNSEVYDAVRRLLQHKFTNRKLTFPLWLTYYLRLLRHGYANRGDVCYSSRRLLSTGFKMPFGWCEGIRRCVEFNKHPVKTVS